MQPDWASRVNANQACCLWVLLRSVADGLYSAALPKERKRCNKKCSEITSKLAKRVQQYNLLVEQYNTAAPSQQRQTTSLEAVKKQ